VNFLPQLIQADHFSGKPGNVSDFDSYLGNVRDLLQVREMSGKKLGD